MQRKKIHTWPTYTLLGVFMVPVGVFAYTYFTADFSLVAQSVAIEETPEPQSPPPLHLAASALSETKTYTEEDTQEDIYPNTLPMTIAGVPVEASIAKSWPERIMGLSNTPFLPENVVKFFVFDSVGFHSIWMKDMRYAIDIFWVDADNTIVHIAENATPDSYPDVLFTPDNPALYVIETVAGFSRKHDVQVGDVITAPDFR